VYTAPRTVTPHKDHGRASRMPIEALRDQYAYVLLGDPGIGKTTAFETEAAAAGTRVIRARDFIHLKSAADALRGQTIFIDGLDEMRAGKINGHTPLDAIRSRLDDMRPARFRISCRSANWLSESDRSSLQALLPVGEELGVFQLDELTELDIANLLKSRYSVAEPRAFMHEAERHRLDDLLRNPQTLQLLAQAVGKNGDWPKSQRETYDLACKYLAAEPNQEHRAAKQSESINLNDLFDAAGYICTLHLIADIQSFSRLQLDGLIALGLNEIKNPDHLSIGTVVETRLFRDLGDNTLAPAHRSIAEFLAARFVAGKLASTLSIGRVTALISGADGQIVSELRAFAAWLAVFSIAFRKQHIPDDPLGILKYGDARNFSAQEKGELLAAIKTKSDSPLGFSWDDWHWSSFKDLATTDITTEFARILRAKPASRGDQTVARCVVRGLAQGDVMEGMGPILLEVISDSQWDNDIRSDGLRAYLKNYLVDLKSALKILENVRNKSIRDEDDELLGILLAHLYPEHVPPEELVKYLHHRKKHDSFIGEYHRFWYELLPRTSDPELSRLIAGFSNISPVKSDDGWQELWRIFSDTLIQAIERLGDFVDDATLYDWLGIRLDDRGHDNTEHAAKARIDKWFASRPARYKGVQLITLTQAKDDEHFWWSIRQRLSGVRPPSDIGYWWLDQAESELRTDRAILYFHNAFWIQDDGSIWGGVSLEELEEWVRVRPRFAEAFSERLALPIKDEHGEDVWQVEDFRRNLAYRQEKRAQAESIRAQLGSLSSSEVPRHLLYYFAVAHQGTLVEARGDTPEQRLADFFDDDAELVAAAFAALEATPARTDLPTPAEILATDGEGKIHHLTPALLVGMELANQRNPASILAFDDTLLSTAITARYVYATGNDPDWFDALVKEKPMLVAEACSKYLLARLKDKREYLHGAYQLAHDSKYQLVAEQVVPIVLARFPHRVPTKQLSTLEYLLKAALRYLGAAELNELIRSRLQLKSLDVAQRVYWLSAGVIINAEKHLGELTKFVAGKEIRVGHLGVFFCRDQGESSEKWPTSVDTRARLIALLAPSCKPDRFVGGWLTADMNRAQLVQGWINKLAANANEAATQALRRLSSSAELRDWFDALGQARLQQSIVTRDFSFVHPNHVQVAETLYQGPPANAADVAAIVNEMLAQIGLDIRTSDLNLYRQFWTLDPSGRPETPNHEEVCRDALAALMRERLKTFHIECTTEARHINEKRSDVLCTFLPWSIPIEIKKDDHRDLWRGINEQLVPKYSIDPRAHGHGIFVALWFGGEKIVRPSTGRKPTTPNQLLEQLKLLVPQDRAHQIMIHVIDCTSPT
jgi:hypothetical protein